ncbi:unnamed protein product [Prorocentrum cordatum]|uniref:Uncharacterized protein n=1 Tax=Prorocentrum cordatum TaxID=2364126 RepID=A0ABN9UHJ8_9DINO|nr:unnamed protein product [Polarella glacialis]
MALIQLPVAQAVFGAAHAGMALGLSAKAMGNLVAAAARGALQGVSAISAAHVEAFETGSTLDKLEEALHAVKKGAGMEATPSVPEAKQQLRQLGKSELASKLGKPSKIRNTIGHPPAGLVCDIAQAFEEEKEVGKPCTVFSTGCQEKKLKDKVKSKGKKIVNAQVAVVEPPPNLIDILLEKSREVVELKRHLELAQAVGARYSPSIGVFGISSVCEFRSPAQGALWPREFTLGVRRLVFLLRSACWLLGVAEARVSPAAEQRDEFTRMRRYHRLPRKLEDDYKRTGKILGMGYSGQVLLAEGRDTAKLCAVKAFKLRGIPKAKKATLESEAEIFLSMDHPHVVRLLDCYECEEFLNLVMECMTGGELLKRVVSKKRFSEKRTGLDLQSIVAGSSHGTRLGQIYLCPILEAAQQAADGASIWSYIDDTVWRAECPRDFVEQVIVDAGVALLEGCPASRLVVSTKTALVASTPALRRRVWDRLRRRGVPGHQATDMVDLGVDVVTGSRRVQRKASSRRARAVRRAGRVLRLRRSAAKLGKRGSAFFSTGVKPQSVYGHEVWGIAPSNVTKGRRLAAAAAAGKGPGRCLRPAMAVLYHAKDPGVQLRVQLVREWLAQWLSQPQLHKRARRIWASVHQKLLRSKGAKWRKVYGQVAAVIATLLDAGWSPFTAGHWKRPTPAGVEQWIIPLADEQGSLSLDLTEFSELLDDLEHDLIQIRWKEAARHLHGGGLEDGGDVWLVKRGLDHCAKEGNWQVRALKYLVVVGGQWPRARQVEAGHLGPDICRRCFGARETLEHRIWTCPCNAGKPAYDQTQHLVSKTLAGVEACPALWLRGIDPRANAIPAAPSDVETILHDLFIFGGASGGARAEGPRRRRAGAAINALRAFSRGAGRELEAGAWALLPGRRQTAPRGGTCAFIIALELVDCGFAFVTDHKALLTAWERGRARRAGKGKNADLWARIGRAVQARPRRRVRLVWAPPRQGDDDDEPIVNVYLAAGNCCALQGAAQFIDYWDVVGWQIRRRARQAPMGAAGGDPWLTERPAARAAPRQTALQEAIGSSPHQLAAVGAQWKCIQCRVFCSKSDLHDFAAAECRRVAQQIVARDQALAAPHLARVPMGHQEVHPSHDLHEWPRFSLFFCMECGAYGTVIGRSLRERCDRAPTRKQGEMLRRILDGRHPSYQGPPAAALRALEVEAAADFVAHGGLAPREPAAGAPAMHGDAAFAEVLRQQAADALQREQRRIRDKVAYLLAAATSGSAEAARQGGAPRRTARSRSQLLFLAPGVAAAAVQAQPAGSAGRPRARWAGRPSASPAGEIGLRMHPQGSDGAARRGSAQQAQIGGVGALWGPQPLELPWQGSRLPPQGRIKLENFLYESEDSDHLKLIDFGFSRILSPNIKLHLSCGTLAYIAPEVLRGSYTNQCDMWSLGVSVFILLLGYMPFQGNAEKLQMNIKVGKFAKKKKQWDSISSSAQDFIDMLMVVDPNDRLTAKQALQHQWIERRNHMNDDMHDVDQGIADALSNFGQASNLRRACMSMMAWSLTNDERKQVRDAFIEIDTDRSGTITVAEFKTVLQDKFHIDDEHVAAAFASLDTNHAEEIHYSEFLAAMVSSRIQLHDDLLRQTFRRFDVDNNGYITREELAELLGEVYEGQDVSKLLDEADSSHDGKIDYNEFIRFIQEAGGELHLEAAEKLIDRAQTEGDNVHKAPILKKKGPVPTVHVPAASEAAETVRNVSDDIRAPHVKGNKGQICCTLM